MMKAPIIWLISGIGGMMAASAAPLNVVATLPDFAALAREIGGHHIQATALAKGTEDAHFVDARPSFIRLLNKADVLIEGGADLEVGWLPPLVQNARNRKILRDGSGYVDAAEGIALLEVPVGTVDRSQGDVHPLGNPHYWLDPANGGIIASHLARVFSQLDPSHAADYQANLKQFEERLALKLKEWSHTMQALHGVKIITYHKNFEYLARRFGLVIAGQIEPKPGLEPSPAHIAELVPQAKQQGVRLVVIEPFRPRRTPAHLAEAIGAKLVVLPDKVEADPQAEDFWGLFDTIAANLSKALQEAP